MPSHRHIPGEVPAPANSTTHFIPTDDFGLVETFAPTPVPPAPEPFGPPDPLTTLRDALEAIAAEALQAQRTAPSTRAGRPLVLRLNALVDEVAARTAHVRPYKRVALVRLPEDILLALPDLLSAVRPARRAVAGLLAERERAVCLHEVSRALRRNPAATGTT